MFYTVIQAVSKRSLQTRALHVLYGKISECINAYPTPKFNTNNDTGSKVSDFDFDIIKYNNF